MTAILGDKRLVLLACYGSIAALLPDIPIQFSISIIIVAIWNAAVHLKIRPTPSKLTINILTLAAGLGIWLHYRSIFNKEAYPVFFSCLIAIKLLEIKTSKDRKFVSLMCLFLIPCKFLFSIDLPTMLFATFNSLMIWLSMYPVNANENTNLKWRLLHFIRLMSFAIPTSLLFYLLFPRIQPFWLHGDGHSEKSTVGFSDQFKPGSIASLAQSNELVFAVEFEGPVQINERDLYWKGMTLDLTDGFSWLRSNRKRQSEEISDITKFQELSYRVTMESDAETLLFPLDLPHSMSSGDVNVIKKRDGTWRSDRILTQRTLFRGKSLYGAHAKTTEADIYMQLPMLSEKVKKLAIDLKFDNSKQKTVKNILLYFREGGYQYTLNPGTMDEHSIDDFLFVKRKGFCEHYASAFAIIARAAGVPSRVVIGYQGGEYNPMGNFYKITKKFAHAWNEYLNDKGEWERVDVVEFVAPTRLELGGEEFLSRPEFLQQFYVRGEGNQKEAWQMMLSFISLSFESLNYSWNRMILDFNLEKQKHLLSLLPLTLGPFLLLILLIVVALLWGPSFASKALSKDLKIKEAYLKFLIWSQDRGVPKEPWEGPLDFKNRLVQIWPEVSGPITDLVDVYINTQYYGQELTRHQLRTVQKSLGQLNRIN